MRQSDRRYRRQLAVLKLLLALFALAAAAIFSFIVVTGISAGDGGGHIETPGNSFGGSKNKLDLVLVRERLETISLNDDGFLAYKKNDDAVDFSLPSAKKQNVFGLTDGMVVGPGSKFTAYMNLSNKSGGAFAFWLGVPLGGDVNDFARQMLFTVALETEEGYETVYSDVLSAGASAGSESQPLAVTESEAGASFQVTVEFLKQDDNNLTKNLSLSFDLVVYAVALSA